MTATPVRYMDKGRQRRTQERTELARAAVISAGVALFSERGFDGVSVRDIETAAEVNRGMLAYHFGDKDNFWKAVADTLFDLIELERNLRQKLINDISAREGLAMIIRFHVRFYAEHPELSRLMSQEARQESWRIRYIVEKHIRPATEQLKRQVCKVLDLSPRQFAHWYYIMVSSSATLFSFEPECELLFGFNPREQSVIDTHAEMIVKMLIPDEISQT